MEKQLEEIREAAMKLLSQANTAEILEELRVRFTGKKGELTAILRGMGGLTPEQRPIIGQLANRVRADIDAEIEKAQQRITYEVAMKKLKEEEIDVTLPGDKPALGRRHLLTKVLDEITDIFMGMGFAIAEGPQVERTKYNFDLLNTPEDHPARDIQDTFYINGDILLRTQTSAAQARFLESHQPPMRMISPGMVYRSDEVDATHSPVFHQIEGLVVDKGITMADLKGTLALFAESFYGPETKVRFRPHYFPFTEPSAEMDVSCFACGGKGCRLCKGEGWIEILGSGMVHPNVLTMCGIDPNVYSGFAFGMGHERIAMLRYKIDDMRLLYENDVRFLHQF